MIIVFLIGLCVYFSLYGGTLGASTTQTKTIWVVLGVTLIASFVRAASSSCIGDDDAGIPSTPKDDSHYPSRHIVPNEVSSLHSNGWTWDRSKGVWKNDKTGDTGVWDEIL